MTIIGTAYYNKQKYSFLSFDEKKAILFPKEKLLSLIIDPHKIISQKEIETVLSNLKFDIPVAPSKIVCVGRNYQDHAIELGNPIPDEPLIFLKPPSCLNPTNSPIIYPPTTKDLHYEGEIALVMRKRIKDASKDELLNISGLFGLTLFNDVTARDLQKKDKTWTRGKGYDTFGCVGPWIRLEPIKDSYIITTKLNGNLKQKGNTSTMKFDFYDIISYISSIMTLEPGDLIPTGTPSGVGPMSPGDIVIISSEDLGSLKNPVINKLE